jgi:hypothetical protein
MAIGRNHIKDPFKRLANIRERLKEVYLRRTIGSGKTDKYLFELYYDLNFCMSILRELGVIPGESPKGDESPNAETISKVVDKIKARIEFELTKDRSKK